MTSTLAITGYLFAGYLLIGAVLTGITVGILMRIEDEDWDTYPIPLMLMAWPFTTLFIVVIGVLTLIAHLIIKPITHMINRKREP